MRKLIFLLIALFPISGLAVDLEEEKVYRLHKTINDLELASDPSQKFVVVKDSKFRVVDSTNDNYYIVTFVTLYNTKPDGGVLVKSTVTTDQELSLIHI